MVTRTLEGEGGEVTILSKQEGLTGKVIFQQRPESGGAGGGATRKGPRVF